MTERNNHVNEELLVAALDEVCGGFYGLDGGCCHPVIVIDPKTHLPTFNPRPTGPLL